MLKDTMLTHYHSCESIWRCHEGLKRWFHLIRAQVLVHFFTLAIENNQLNVDSFILFKKNRLHVEMLSRNYTENRIICNNDMCFDLTRKHLFKKKQKKGIFSELASQGIKKYIKAPLYWWLLLSLSDYLLILFASKLGQTLQILFNNVKLVFC